MRVWYWAALAIVAVAMGWGGQALLFPRTTSVFGWERRAAVESCSDQSRLATMALKDEDWRVREAAVRRLSDQSALLRVALRSDEQCTTQTIAVAKLESQSQLAELAIAGGPVADAALAKVTDQAELARVALGASRTREREYATMRLTSQPALMEVALGDREWLVRKAALPRLTDQSALARVATADSSSWIRDMAFEKIRDQEALAYVALSDGKGVEQLRLAAIRKLTDASVLARIATGSAGVEERLLATQSLEDQTALKQIALYDSAPQCRLAAIARLSDQGTLAHIAMEEALPGHRRAAIGRLTDPLALARVASTDGDRGRRQLAILRLDAQRVSNAVETTHLAEDQLFLGAVSKIVESAQVLPDRHRTRILAELLVLARCYVDPTWRGLYGELAEFTLEWKEVSKEYFLGMKGSETINAPVMVRGESIVFRAKFTGSDPSLTGSWHSWLAETVVLDGDSDFIPANVVPTDAWIPWLVDHPSVLAGIACDHDSVSFRIAAIQELEDQEVLGRIVKEQRGNSALRVAAIGRLTDESLLKEVAAEKQSRRASQAARERLRAVE